MIKGFTENLGAERLVSLVSRLLEDARDFQLSGQFDSYATNLDVASKLALEIRGDPKMAHKFSVLALEQEAKITHKWVLQEHHWREAAYYRGRNDLARSRLSVIAALRLFRDHPVVLEPTPGAGGPVPHDPIAELPHFGISEEELREHGVAPSGNPPPELPLMLDRNRAARLVERLL